ncbi:hypothetical protein ABZT47_04265 [Sphaerisporangium sp. NPDC005289]
MQSQTPFPASGAPAAAAPHGRVRRLAAPVRTLAAAGTTWD